jgi:hypothetical protein
MKQLTATKKEAICNGQLAKRNNKKGARLSYSPWFICLLSIAYCYLTYSSSSKFIASLVVCNSSYSSLLPTIMFSNSRKPVPAGIK